MDEDREMFQRMPWPFPNDSFPPSLGAVVQRTVLDGTMPALVVGHTADGSWFVGDDVNDPNTRGAAIATHIGHAIALNSSIAGLATLPPGRQARRSAPGEPWLVSELEVELETSD
jgi:hypothetical protein